MLATEQKEREEPEEISVLHRVSRIVSSELSLDEMLGEIVGLTSQISGCDACLVYLVESPTEEFVLRASQVPHAADLGNLRMKVGEGVTGWVAEHQSPVALSSKAADDPRFKFFPALVEDTYEALLSVQVINKRKDIARGTRIRRRRSRPFSSWASKWAARSPRACSRKRTRA
jgi:uroporphyrinogen-III synthase